MNTKTKHLLQHSLAYFVALTIGTGIGINTIFALESDDQKPEPVVVTEQNLDVVVEDFYTEGIEESIETGLVIRDSNGQEVLAETGSPSQTEAVNQQNSSQPSQVVVGETEPEEELAADPETTIVASRNPFIGTSLHVSEHDPAGWTAAEWASSNPSGAAALNKISGESIGVWLGRWATTSYVSGIMNAATARGEMPVFVIYSMPQEGCTGLPGSANDYISWAQSIADTIGNRDVMLIIEPDELPITNCTPAQEDQRLAVVADAVSRFKKNPRANIYIDAGHSNWVSPAEMASRLRKAGIDGTRGFSLNVSNYRSVPESQNYGQRLVAELGGFHYVIDTSRNGLGPSPDNEWCNAPGRALGPKPGAANFGANDGYLWIKYPGESDLACNGGPSEGQWWPEYAVGLAERAAF